MTEAERALLLAVAHCAAALVQSEMRKYRGPDVGNVWGERWDALQKAIAAEQLEHKEPNRG